MRRTTVHSRRLDRERRTIGIMIEIFCHAAHRDNRKPDRSGRGATDSRSPLAGLCPDCAALRDYALWRIEHCRFGAKKPVCASCPAHCYRPDMREKIRAVMRYSGPRMLTTHPWLTVCHMIDRARRVPPARNSDV